MESVKFFNLERVIEAKAFRMREPKEISMKEYFEEFEESVV